MFFSSFKAVCVVHSKCTGDKLGHQDLALSGDTPEVGSVPTEVNVVGQHGGQEHRPQS